MPPDDAPADRLDRMLALARRHVPDLRLVHKADVAWMRAAARALRPVNPHFQDRFTTVIGSTVYLPEPPDRIRRDALAATLAHELVHQLDQRRYGPLFYASYAVPPLGRTARAAWERRAYAVDLMLAWDRGGDKELDRVLDRLATVFSGPAYLWMWAGRDAARAYLEPVARAVRDGTLQGQAPYAEILAAWRGPKAG